MKVYRVAWDFNTTYWFEVEAENEEQAENMVYEDGDEYLVEKIEESKEINVNELLKCDVCDIKITKDESVELESGNILCYGCDSKRLEKEN